MIRGKCRSCTAFNGACGARFLCGQDPLTGNSYVHRRHWVRSRLEFLAGIFGIDCLTYTVMSSHVHLVRRSRPVVVATWTDDEVARRWLRLFPRRENKDGSPAEPKRPQRDMLVNRKEVLAEIRRRRSGWMSPIEIDQSSDPVGADANPSGRRESQKGFLSVSLLDGLQPLDWTGRRIYSDKRGAIPNHLAPILTRIGLDARDW